MHQASIGAFLSLVAVLVKRPFLSYTCSWLSFSLSFLCLEALFSLSLLAIDAVAAAAVLSIYQRREGTQRRINP